MTTTISLTEKQYRWLKSRGGRNQSDLVINDGMLGVYMSNGKGMPKFVRIPHDDLLEFIYFDSDKRKGYYGKTRDSQGF